MMALLATSKVKPEPLMNTLANAVVSPINEVVLATMVEPRIAAPVTDRPVPAPFSINVPLSFVYVCDAKLLSSTDCLFCWASKSPKVFVKFKIGTVLAIIVFLITEVTVL